MPRIPNLNPPADPVMISNDDVENFAVQTRQFWNLGDGPISNVVWLAENNGCVVVRSDLDDEKLDAYSNWDADDSWRCYIFLGTDKQSAVRSRYDVAHELGHAVMHRNTPDRVKRKSDLHRLMEQQANRFAGAFMMPATSFPSEVYSPTIQTLLHLKSRWQMSISSMICRLFDLESIDEDRKRLLFIQMSRNGWRRREPLDDSLEPEEPRLLKRTLDLLLDNGILYNEELVRRTHLSARVIEKVLGISEGYLDEPPATLSLPLRLG